MAFDDADNLVLRLLADIRHEIGDLRREVRDIRRDNQDLLGFVRDRASQTDRRLLDIEATMLRVGDDISFLIKTEVGGRMAGFGSRIETRLEEALSASGLGVITDNDRPD